MNKYIIALVAVVLVIAGWMALQGRRELSSGVPGFTNTSNSPNPSASGTKATVTPKVSTTPTPSTTSTFSLKVPFTPQAPTANWDEEHNEACEEASALMAAAYLLGDTRAKMPAAEAEAELTKLFNWERSHFGYSLDTTTAETAEMIRLYYHLKAEVISNYTEKDIKDAINANKVVIVSVNGQLIGNPYYKQPGPIYHMLVVRGYTSTQLITNDPGTRNGENYKYSFSTLRNAAADWSHSTDTIDRNKSVMIVVSK